MSRKKVPAAETPPTKAGPGPRNKAAMEAAIEEYRGRPMRVSVEWNEAPDGGMKVGSPHADHGGHALQLTNAFGTASAGFVNQSLGQLEWATRDRGGDRCGSATEVNAALAMLGAIGPQDELEAALGMQMAGCHALTMEMLGRAKVADRIDHIELYGNMAVKLQRTFTGQVEALARLRGKGQQTVRVEHVTVQPGAQAIVGDVHHHAPGGPGAQSRTEDRPHGTTATAAGAGTVSALPCPDPLGNGVPVPGNAERPMSPARRPVTRRARQPERLQTRTMEPGDDRDPTNAADDAA